MEVAFGMPINGRIGEDYESPALTVELCSLAAGDPAAWPPVWAVLPKGICPSLGVNCYRWAWDGPERRRPTAVGGGLDHKLRKRRAIAVLSVRGRLGATRSTDVEHHERAAQPTCLHPIGTRGEREEPEGHIFLMSCSKSRRIWLTQGPRTLSFIAAGQRGQYCFLHASARWPMRLIASHPEISPACVGARL